tara:strand:+ start:38 stop:424 length:387 start_codon:yes stop_codon:yes gene_type:complete
MRLKQYRSPDDEASTYKNIPMCLLNDSAIKRLKKTHKIRIKFRGPRCGMYTTMKKDAISFTIYIDCTMEAYKRQQAVRKLADQFARDIFKVSGKLPFDSFSSMKKIAEIALDDAMFREFFAPSGYYSR